MSDQTSPPTDPTTPPADGVASGAGEGAAPPPPPGGTAVDAAPPPPAPAKKSRTGLIVAIIAGLVVLALVAVLLVVFVFAKGEDKHSITIPSTAGGMKRDKDKEAEMQQQQQLTAAEEQFKNQVKNTTYVKSGIYNQDDSDRGPEGALVFLGAKVKASEKNPQRFVDRLTKLATTNGFKIDKVSAGDGGGKAVCAYQSKGQKIAICGWATKDSAGELIPLGVTGWDSKQLSKVMLDMRSDVEKTE
jgi:hypothetical protein